MSYYTTAGWIALLRRLPPQGACLNVSSLRTLTGLSEKAVRQACWRLSKAGLLSSLGAGWYASSLHSPALEEIGCLLVRPSYISLDRALLARGATTQPCHPLTCVTTRPTTRRETPFGAIDYQSISRRLFWGFRQRQGPNGLSVFEAEPEKALLDLIYLSRRAGEPIFIDIDFSRFDGPKLREYAKRFPGTVQRAIEPLRRAQSAA
ncbi:MAG: hypothetical protein HYR60_33035 [Acidobacteria bacterium]|nr:hypothetical protein [Acidobacteriota bacterium]